MESTSGAISSFFASTKTKLIVLSSLLGVSAIFYFTKNYLQQGQFLPAKTSKKIGSCLKGSKSVPKIVGGKRRVVIHEIDGKQTTQHILKQSRSRRSSRRSSITSVKLDDDKASDQNLNKAVADFSQSLGEIETIFDLNKDTHQKQSLFSSDNSKIENEMKRLKNILEFAQDIQMVTEKTNNYLTRQSNYALEDIFGVDEANALESDNYNEIVQSIRDQKAFATENESEFDSDLDSFISATESVEVEEETPEETVNFNRNLKDVIAKHSKNDFYMKGIEYLTHFGVPVRRIRTQMLRCDNDIDFCVKVHCLRRAFKDLLRVEENRTWFVESGRDVLACLLQKANYDASNFSLEYDEMIAYCQDTDNWGDIDEELDSRGVCVLNFYDIVLDFMVMDSFHDLENPPSAITTAIQNRWLSVRIKETALSTAIWTVIKSKKRNLKNQAGFCARFYDLSMHLTPLLAWGFLGPVKELNDLCTTFKTTMIGFLCDIFSTDVADYKSVHTLSEDILRLAKQRRQELFAILA